MEKETITLDKKHKWIKILSNTLFVTFIVFCLFLAYGLGINNKFYKLIVVTSGSMDPVFEEGDLICVTKINPNEIKQNDIITFQNEEGRLLTHRVIEIDQNGDILTKGDANNSSDLANEWQLDKAKTKYSFRIPKIGYLVLWCNRLFTSTEASLTDRTIINNNEITAEIPTPTPTPVPTEIPIISQIPDQIVTPTPEITPSIDLIIPEITDIPETTIIPTEETP